MATTVPIKLNNTEINEMFPSTKTGTINKLITENSITRLINRLLDVNSYVISSEWFKDAGVNKNDEVIRQIELPNNNDYIEITNNIQNSDVEFSIRGYYFNLGTYTDLFSKVSPLNLSNNDSVVATIFISNDTEYPEMYGQESMEQRELSGDVGTNVVFPDECTNENVPLSSIMLYDKDGERIPTSGTGSIVPRGIENHILVDSNGGTIQYSEDGVASVKYVFHISIESLYLRKQEASNDTPQEIDVPTGYSAYDLILFKKISNGRYGIPISSLHKFDTISIARIDGGVIGNVAESSS